MTLFSICTNAADEIGLERPATVYGSTNPTAQKLYRYANRVGNALMKGYAWQILRAEQTFTALGQEEQTGILPSDFDRFVPETFWNRSTQILISGPKSDVDWATLKAENQTLYDVAYFILRGGSVFIYSAPSAGGTLAFTYVKNTWARSSGGTAQTSFLADTDTSVIDEELITLGVIYAFLAGDGQPFVKAQEAFDDRYAMLIDNDQPSASILSAGDMFGRNSRHFGGTPGVGNSIDLQIG